MQRSTTTRSTTNQPATAQRATNQSTTNQRTTRQSPTGKSGPPPTPRASSPGAPAPTTHVQRYTDHLPETGAGSGGKPVVRPTPPRPLDSGPKLPPPAHPHPEGAPAALGRARTSTAPAAAPGPAAGHVPVRWTSDVLVQRRTAEHYGPTPSPQRAPGQTSRAPGQTSREQGPTSRTASPTSSGSSPHRVAGRADGPTPPAGRVTAGDQAPDRADAGNRPGDLAPRDLDDLARRLLEPVGRLLRAELRQGRERAGRLHDRRR
ncbi:hypothetical protein ACFV4N_35395 [Actinosynnema sp. NPDC059797]